MPVDPAPLFGVVPPAAALPAVEFPFPDREPGMIPPSCGVVTLGSGEATGAEFPFPFAFALLLLLLLLLLPFPVELLVVWVWPPGRPYGHDY